MIPARPSTELSREDFERFRELVRSEIGLVVPEARRRELGRAVTGSLLEAGVESFDDLHDLLTDRGDRRHLEAFVGKLTVGETHFFRNRPQFDALEHHVLPELVASRSDVRRLRLWSAGCSSGEEAYSLAIILHRLIPDLQDWNITILATDINREALERGQHGVYGPWSFRDVGDDIKKDYFKAIDGRLEVHPAIRGLITFGYLNLVDDAYPSLHTNTTAMDLVLCRNVLIYFEAPTVQKVVDRLHQSLVEGGCLAVAAAEFSQFVFREFEACNFPDTVIYRKSAAATRVAGDRRRSAPVPTDAAPDVSTESPGRPAETAGAFPQRRDEDLAELERQCQSTPDDPTPPYLAARLLAGRLELEHALGYVEMSLERAPLFAPSHYIKGLILLEGGDVDGALAAVRRSVFCDPDFALGHFMLAGLFSRAGKTDRSLKALEVASDLLQGADPNAGVPEGDGLTVGRLLELVEVQRELVADEAAGPGHLPAGPQNSDSSDR
jgi:chemotaxis protein methyltransferase CheR